MKKNIINSQKRLFFCGLLLASMYYGLDYHSTQVNAAIIEDQKTTATFKGEFVDPIVVDPTNPDESGPSTGGITDQSGPLSLDYVSNWIFETGKANMPIQQILKAKPDNQKNPSGTATDYPNFVQVTDQRSEGIWNLSADFTDQLKSSSGSELTGAVITLGMGTIRTQSSNNSKPPTGTNSASILDTENGAQTIMSADGAGSSGVWVESFGTANNPTLQLTVPLSVMPKNEIYTGQLQWILASTVPNK